MGAGSLFSASLSGVLLYFVVPIVESRARMDSLVRWNGILMMVGILTFALSAFAKTASLIFGNGVAGMAAGFIVGAPDVVLMREISKSDDQFMKKRAEFQMYNTVVFGVFFAIVSTTHFFTENIGIAYRVSLYLTLGVTFGTYAYSMYGWANDEEWVFEEEEARSTGEEDS